LLKYIRTPKDNKIPKYKMIYRHRKTLNYQKIWNTKRYRSTTKYEIPKNIKISKEKKRKTKDIIYQNIQEYQNIWKIISYKYQSITKDIKLYQ